MPYRLEADSPPATRRLPDPGIHRRRAVDRERANHDRRLAWLAEAIEHAVADSDADAARRYAELLEAEQSRHAEKLRRFERI